MHCVRTQQISLVELLINNGSPLVCLRNSYRLGLCHTCFMC